MGHEEGVYCVATASCMKIAIGKYFKNDKK